MKVYTKTGDRGTTSLISGERVSKYDDRVEAYGTVDELTAFIALLADKMRAEQSLTPYIELTNSINTTLMNIEAHLAAGDDNTYPLPEVTTRSIEELEREIDTMQSALPTITEFTLPGGCKLNSLSHVCRTVCRRAERRALRVSESHPLDENVLIYLNRLSDYFYLLGRTLIAHCGRKELFWSATQEK